MNKGDRVLNMASGSRGVISGDAMWRLSNSHHSKWAYGVKKDNGQYTAWSVENVVKCLDLN